MVSFQGPHSLTGDLVQDLDEAQMQAFQNDQAILQTELDRVKNDYGLVFADGNTLCTMRALLHRGRRILLLEQLRQIVDALFALWRDAMIEIDCAITRYTRRGDSSGDRDLGEVLEQKERYRVMQEWFGDDC